MPYPIRSLTTARSPAGSGTWCAALLALLVLLCFAAGPAQAAGDKSLGDFLGALTPGSLVPGADEFGAPRGTPPVVPVLESGREVGHVFLNTDFVGSVGYSGKPIRIVIALDKAGRVSGLRMVDHKEPIVLIGIPESRIRAVVQDYVGFDIPAFAAGPDMPHDVDIISGATVTIMVIDDAIIRSSIKVARRLGLGGLSPEPQVGGPRYRVSDDTPSVRDWETMVGDGSVRRLRLSVGEINEAFANSGDAEAAARPEAGAPAERFIDLYAADVSVPSIGRSLLGEAEYANLAKRLEPEQAAIWIAAAGRYSFKGSGYVRGGVFDRFQVVQDDISIRFRDKHHKRLGAVAAEGAPAMDEIDLFVVPTDSGFVRAKGWRVELLVHRAVGAIRKAFLTFDLGYRLPAEFLVSLAPKKKAGGEAADDALTVSSENTLWQRMWREREVEIAVLSLALLVLTAVFFFQNQVARHARAFAWFRYGFLACTLVGLGWYANAQLSVVNVLTFMSALLSDFSWSYFLMDPLLFLLWFAVAASLLFWGRGAFCGWLCPFGALQELTNRLARLVRVPQWRLPWGLHERLWPLKYMIFLVLFGISLHDLALAERLAEVEPFKTAIILKFAREWPFVAFALALLAIGLFIERFYCRYLCPLGAALAIPARLRMFDWLKRYRECGNPCLRCANDCMVQAIHPEGHINPNECLQCLHCQTLYQDDHRCPVMIQRRLKRERREALASKAPAT